MGTRIGAIRGVPVSEAKATDIIKEIVSSYANELSMKIKQNPLLNLRPRHLFSN